MLSVLAEKINMRNPIFLTVVQIFSEVYRAYASVKDFLFCSAISNWSLQQFSHFAAMLLWHVQRSAVI